MYTISVAKEARIISKFIWDTEEYTFKSSMNISAENVIVTILANESMKNAIEANIIHAPWNKLYQLHIKNVLNESAQPF